MDFLLVLALLIVLLGVLLQKIGARGRDLPPGPPTLPIIGNLHIMPKESPHFKFTEWARKYGGIYSLKIGTATTIVLTDPEIVKELLERRTGTTSDRPAMYVSELVTGGMHIAFARYGETWRTLRKAIHSILTPQATERQLPIQRAEAIQLLHDILCTPENFHNHIGRYTNSVIMSVLYGQRSPRFDTPQTAGFYDMVRQWVALLEPGATPPIDLLPILKWVPAKWQEAAKRIRGAQRELYFGMLEATKERVQNGEENGSFMEEVLAKQVEFGLDKEMVAYLAGTLIEGASDTTLIYLMSFILCMVACPDAQRKAQQELDRVVGQDRLPTLEDLDSLPYIRALIHETHRFRPVAPLLVPHATTADERYGDYIIPNGSTIFVNAWGILHDPNLFDDPHNFVPERYLLTENGTKPGLDTTSLKNTLAFGVGRRSCPGIHLAQTSISINVMNLLWAFHFQPALDSDGNLIKPGIFAYSKGISCAPLPFNCRITPRTAEKPGIIRREFADAAAVFEKFEFGLSAREREFLKESRSLP